ncbi:MAG: PD40 domain-containing protein, partial [Thermoguttaceae bacterium]|nr:PD40 domain-containing protein [Thermoguttaceae bacterium]
KLLKENAGKSIKYDVYVKTGGAWRKYRSFENYISTDPIDPYVAYRVIEPGYEYANRISLVERSLESFSERYFFHNQSSHMACINCHNFQNRQTDSFLFHFRNTSSPEKGGTIIVRDGKALKVTGKLDANGLSCSYPAWRPTGDLVAFSINHTRQIFHSLSTQKVEVYDAISELAILNAATNTIVQITDTPDEFETFPSWSPDGKTLYYARATVKLDSPLSELKKREHEAPQRIEDFHYDIMKMDFDEAKGTFGPPEIVVEAASKGKTALFPRVSPDGKFMVYTVAKSGTFPIWRPETDLYIKNLETGEERPLDKANGENSDSYHTWDSSGRWMVFSSRREDGQYTRLYFTHVDENGNETKPFMLPQKDPAQNKRFFKSYNVPEIIAE